MPVRLPETRTTSGRVRGRPRDPAPGGPRIAEYLGIPYAQPPVGELRFAAPAQARPWDGTRDATAFGPAAPQASAATDGEQWLTLNVWTPDTGGGGLPVFVWVHGGSYHGGSSRQPAYDGSLLAAAGLVVVTCNYRLGVEGFAQLDGAVANRGLLDVLAVLRWVAANAAAFGGDPANVTLAGESAGAGIVASLLAMDATRSLVRRAVTQSMTSTFFSAELAADVAAAVADAAGLPSPSACSFAAVPPDRLVAAAGAVEDTLPARSRWGKVMQSDTAFSPVVDGEVLTQTPWRAMRAGKARDVELLAGHNRNEFRMPMFFGDLIGRVTEADTARVLTDLDAEDYRAAFPGASAEELFEIVKSDWLFRMATVLLARAHAGMTYLYELTYPAPGSGGVLGACHALDVPLLFGAWGGGGLARTVGGDNPPASLLALGDVMRAEWAAFASSGDPGWQAYRPDEQLTRIYADPPTVTAYPEQASLRLWDDDRFDPLPLLGA